MCPTKNGFANFTLLRFCRHFRNHYARLVAGRVFKGNMQIAVQFGFEIVNAAALGQAICSQVGCVVIVASTAPLVLSNRRCLKV